MKIFLSSLENCSANKDKYRVNNLSSMLMERNVQMKWNLMSYYYLQGKDAVAEQIRDNSEEIMIDSGAHSFQFGIKTDFAEYTKKYAEFIKRFDRPNVVGYFEMDIENVIGMEKVLELRKYLEHATDKVIPVWHKGRGIDDYLKMCEAYAGKVIAIGGFRGTDIRDDQYLMFIKYAKKYGCKVHCLGMTRTSVLDKVPFDYTDSASWHMHSIYGTPYLKDRSKKFARAKNIDERNEHEFFNYCEGIKLQEHYHRKWRKVCKD